MTLRDRIRRWRENRHARRALHHIHQANEQARQTVGGGYAAGRKRVEDLSPPPRGPAPGAQAYRLEDGRTGYLNPPKAAERFTSVVLRGRAANVQKYLEQADATLFNVEVDTGPRAPDVRNQPPLIPLKAPEPGQAVVLIVGAHPASAVDVTADIRALLDGDTWGGVTLAERRLRRLLG